MSAVCNAIGSLNADKPIFCDVTTRGSLVSIAVTPSGSSIPYGNSRQFTAIGTYADGTSTPLSSGVTWSTVDTCSLYSLQAYAPTAISSLLLGSLTPLTAAEKIEEGRNQFNAISALAKTGNSQAINSLQGITSLYINLYANYYGTGGSSFRVELDRITSMFKEILSFTNGNDLEMMASNACGLASLNSYYDSNVLINISTSPAEKLSVLSQQFNDLAVKARLGSTAAIWEMQNVAYTFLAASKYYNGGTATSASYKTDFLLVYNTLNEIGAISQPIAAVSISSNSGLSTGRAVGTSIVIAKMGGLVGRTTLTVSMPTK